MIPTASLSAGTAYAAGGYSFGNVLSTGSVTINLPVSLFDTSATKEKDTKKVTIEAEGYATTVVDLTYRNVGATALTVRVLDESGNVLHAATLTDEQLRALNVQSAVSTSANCGMAGLRSFTAEGVYLSDVLKVAQVQFGPGMTLKLRTTDYATTNDGNGGTEDAYISSGTFTYEDLMGVARYHYPAMWDNTTRYDELGGKTVYEVISENMAAWKDDTDEAKALAAIIGASKVEVPEPVIGLAWNEDVVAWGGTNPSTQTWGDNTYNAYTSHETYRFLFGMKANEDGSIADDNTTFSNTYGVFGIDIIASEYVPPVIDNPDNPDDPDNPDNPVNPPISGGDDNDGNVGNTDNGDNPSAGKDNGQTGAKSPDKLAQTGDTVPLAVVAVVALGAVLVLVLAYTRSRKQTAGGVHLRK